MTIKTTVWMKRKNWTGCDTCRVELTIEDLEKLAFEKAKECKSNPEEFELNSVDFDGIKL
jgi:hypothetical protein